MSLCPCQYPCLVSMFMSVSLTVYVHVCVQVLVRHHIHVRAYIHISDSMSMLMFMSMHGVLSAATVYLCPCPFPWGCLWVCGRVRIQHMQFCKSSKEVNLPVALRENPVTSYRTASFAYFSGWCQKLSTNVIRFVRLLGNLKCALKASWAITKTVGAP